VRTSVTASNKDAARGVVDGILPPVGTRASCDSPPYRSGGMQEVRPKRASRRRATSDCGARTSGRRRRHRSRSRLGTKRIDAEMIRAETRMTAIPSGDVPVRPHSYVER